MRAATLEIFLTPHQELERLVTGFASGYCTNWTLWTPRRKRTRWEWQFHRTNTFPDSVGIQSSVAEDIPVRNSEALVRQSAIASPI